MSTADAALLWSPAASGYAWPRGLWWVIMSYYCSLNNSDLKASGHGRLEDF